MKALAIWLVAWLLASSLPGQPSNRHLYTFHALGPGDRLGASVSGVGDIDRDGYADVMVGAPEDDRNGRRAGSAQVFSGRDGRVLFTFLGDFAGDWFGAAVSGAGDVDRDGYPDLIVGAPFAFLGMARVFSGKDGRILRTLRGYNLFDRFGWAVAGAGDVNGDGHADVVVGAYAERQFAGTARVYSGKDGALLHTFVGQPRDFLGWSVAGAGDVDGDARADLIVGAPGDRWWPGCVVVYSGRDGSVLWEIRASHSGGQLGYAVGRAGDLNRDGHADLLVSVPFDSYGGALVYSGKDGSLLRWWWGAKMGDDLGYSVSGVADVDGDAVRDIVVGVPGPGFARVFSGRDSTTLFTVSGNGVKRFGESVSGAGDVNGDGIPEVVVGAPLARVGGQERGLARVASGKPLSLVADTHQLSLSTLTSQSLYLDAGPAHGGRSYRLAGSLGGITPGFPLGPFRVPLNPDPYFLFTLFFPNQPPLRGSAGTLDGQGRAVAALTLMPGLPGALRGLRADHAFVVLGPPVGLVSNPVPVTLVR